MSGSEAKRARGRSVLAVLTVLLLLVAGSGVAALVSDSLGIRAEPSERMGETHGPAATQSRTLELRMADLGAVGVRADPAQWLPQDDYTHASRAFANVYMPDPPYIDSAALQEAFVEFDEYARHIRDAGYNAIAWPGMIEFVTLESVTGGPVYAAGDDHIAKALALREAFEPFWQHAEDLGMKIFLRTDMLALTEPLERFLIDRFGSLDTANPELWRVYTDALDELYTAAPALDGVLIRVGEAGDIYEVEGWDYFSALAVRSVPAARAMLTAFTQQAEASDREVIFRTWSVGVGGVGDMHTNPDSYAKVLDGIDSPALIVSTKYTLGDFYSWLPLNITLEHGDQRRIVEFQSRREYEWFGAWPNDLGAEYAWALRSLVEANPNIEGVWGWTQDGGPWRAGPMNLFLKSGFWYFADLNAMHTAALAQNPATDPAVTTRAWVERYFSTEPATIDAIARAMALSREAIEQGLYIQPFAENRVFAIGLEPPPMMWLFEWDILTGDSAVLGVVYSVAREHFDEAIAGGQRALDAAHEMQRLIEATDAATWRNAELRDGFLQALAYEIDTLEVLAAYRAMFLHQGRWHDTRSSAAADAWRLARDAFEARAAAHVQQYTGDVMHPPLNLTAAQLGVERADRDLMMAWTARVLLLLAAVWLALGLLGRAPAARAHWLGATRPWSQPGTGLSRASSMLLIAFPALLLVTTRLVQTSFLAPAQLVVTLGAWAIFVLVALVLARKAAWPLVAALGGVIVLRCMLTLGALSFTGPGGYWFSFWTDPVRRTLYITLAFALFLWAFIAAAWALAPTVGRRRATGAVLAGTGSALAMPALLIDARGLERALTIWNDQLGLLPWGLSRILGITVHVGIPTDAALIAGAVGAAIAIAGLALSLPRRASYPAGAKTLGQSPAATG